MTKQEIANGLIKAYKEGKDANQGGLSFVKNYEYKGLLMGFYLNARVGIDPNTEELKVFDIQSNTKF